VRNDCGVLEGSEVTIHYDPMLAKLVVWGRDRPEALRRLRRALLELRVEGIHTTAPLFLDLLEDEDFLAARLDIGMLDRKLRGGALAPGARPGPRIASEDLARDLPIIAAALAHQERSGHPGTSSGTPRARRRWAEASRREGLRS
jgi:acetyl/propionyl-CoA carboxylase alpha subunit